jgi:hypothetical protein
MHTRDNQVGVQGTSASRVWESRYEYRRSVSCSCSVLIGPSDAALCVEKSRMSNQMI